MMKSLSASVLLMLLYGFGNPAMAWFFASDIKSDEEVILFPTTAHYDSEQALWHVPVHGWIFERETGSIWRSALASAFIRGLGITDDLASQTLFRERASMFLVDSERNKRLTVRVGGRRVTAKKSGADGHFHTVVTLPLDEVDPYESNGWLDISLVMPEGDGRSFAGRVQLVSRTGVSVISDIDDTVKVTNVLDKRAVVENTFLKPFAVVPGMEKAYARWAEQGAAFHYVSSSPWQLYPALAAFFHDVGLPPGSFHLKTYRVQDGTFFDLFASPFDSKVARVSQILAQFPERKFVLVGDSGEKDPEVYAAIYGKHGEQVLHICIRNVTGEDADAARYVETFQNVPREHWSVFEEPETLRSVALPVSQP